MLRRISLLFMLLGIILQMINNHVLRNLSFGSAGVVTIALVVATLVERIAGSETAFSAIYHSPWLIALWIVTSSCSGAYIIKSRRMMSWATMGLHLSFVVILLGALITFMIGKQGKLTLKEGAEVVASFMLDDGAQESLPFAISLDHCEVEYYPGTSTPMDYASVVVVRQGTDSSSYRLSMNNILDIDGYRFYQTSLGEGSSTLSVSYDPWGIGVTYGGYILLIISMCGFFFSHKSRFRLLLIKGVTIICFIFVAFGASAAQTRSVPQTIPRQLAAHFGKINLYWGDRVMPLQTMARDFCLKVYGSTSYRGLTAEQVLAGWLFYYDSWKNEPFIKIEGSETARLLGLEGSRYASIKDFYSPGGYKLEHAVASNLSDRKLQETDARVALVTMACSGSAFSVFPISEGDDNMTPVRWLSFADRPPVSLSEGDYVFISTILDRISREVARRQWKNADDEFNRLREFQLRTAPDDTFPTHSRVEAELLYNRFGSPLWPGVMAIIVGLAGILLQVRVRFVTVGVAFCSFLWLTAILGLRWYVGRHIPLSNGYETMLVMGWLSIGCSMLFLLRSHFLLAGYSAMTVGGLSLMVAMMGQSGATVSHLMPVLASPLLSIHVLLVMSSYALLAIITILSAVNLCRHSEDIRLSLLLLYPAVFLLAVGIFVGGVWANQSWGRYWGWDPKETWALITLLIYALPLHGGSFATFCKPKTLNVYLLLSFMSVLMTYFGVNYLLSGLHSYA